MRSRNLGGALICASVIGIAAAAPGAASAAPTNFDCYPGTVGSPYQHEVGEAESDAYCAPNGADDPVTITPANDAAHGTVTVRDNGTSYPTLVYTATGTGTDTYTFSATDGTDTQVYTAHTDNRAATNDPPNCLGPQMSMDDLVVGHAYPIGQCSDEEGETGNITVSVVQQPAHGTVSVQDQGGQTPTIVYTPTSNGDDTFTFKGNDGTQDSLVAGASVHNIGGAAAPVVQPKPATPAPAVTFGLKKVPASIQIASNGTAVIPVTGTPGSKGSVVVSSDKAIASAKKKAKKAILKFAHKGFTVPKSGLARVKVTVSGKALKALKKARKIKVKVTIKTDKTTVTKRIVLKAPKAKKHAKK
jgi:hypothetical protein